MTEAAAGPSGDTGRRCTGEVRDQMDDINSIVMFGNKAESAAAPEATVEAAPAAAATTAVEVEQPRQERDESGKFKAANTEPAKAPEQAAQQQVQPEPAKVERGQMAALMAERAKRQQAEQRAAELERRLQGGQPQEEPDIFTDPGRVVQEHVNKAVAPFRQVMFNQSVALAESQYPDFSEAAQHFLALTEQNPQLRENWLNSDNPGEFAYRVGASTPEFRQAFAKRYTDQVSAKDAEIATLKAQLADLQKAQLNAVPESLNRQPSGAVPARESNDLNVNEIVRFK
jgi:hypothetical protein